jgi:DNA uptake protein ComE-like DNA-binding protein
MRHIPRSLFAIALALAVCAPAGFAQTSSTGSAMVSDSTGTTKPAVRHHRKHRRHKKATTHKTSATAKRKHRRGTTMSARAGRAANKPIPFVKRVDVNTASREDLMKLPGVTADLADRIIAARPFDDGQQLVSKGILTGTEYRKIEHRISTK